MKKKILIISGVLVGVVGIILIFLYTLFALKSVDINFRSSLTNLTSSQTEIVKSGSFKFGSPIFFQNKNQYIKQLEQNNPYIEIINIETRFPNKLVVHARERQEMLAFNHDGKVYTCDFTLKVIKVSEGEFDSNSTNPILIASPQLLSNPTLGAKVVIKDYVDFYSALLNNNLKLHEQKELIKSVGFGSLHDENINKSQPYAKMVMHSGQTVVIKNSQYLLDEKMAKTYFVYSNIFSLIGEKINDTEEVWTKELLEVAIIEINNYYVKDEVYSKITPPVI